MVGELTTDDADRHGRMKRGERGRGCPRGKSGADSKTGDQCLNKGPKERRGRAESEAEEDQGGIKAVSTPGPSMAGRRITKGTKVRKHEKVGISEVGMGGEETWRSRAEPPMRRN